MSKTTSALVVTSALACASVAQAQVVIETVTVGNPGNTSDTRYAIPGCGGVPYEYDIAMFEVTAGQYAEFLNAVAATDTYELYHRDMDRALSGCQITRNGVAGSYTYDFSGRPGGTEADWVDRPVNYVSWAGAARFANWLHNGQPFGMQDETTTEDGSYFLNGARTTAELMAITREPDATWVIPTEDEWYKAAYHANDGVTGSYWDYAMGSNATPDNGYPDADTGNSANFFDGEFIIPYGRTDVGYFGLSPSPYGTFDQNGNVSEWNEATFETTHRGFRGGAFSGVVATLRASYGSYTTPRYASYFLGFRLVRVSGPGCAPDPDGRVTICHRPPGNQESARTMTVSVQASAAHLGHGDSCGPCP